MHDWAEYVGWASSLVLVITIGRQVYSQWRSGQTAGVSKWLFVGQLAASTGFVIYSLAVSNWVFVVTNAVMLLIAIVGEVLYWQNRRRRPPRDSIARA